MPGLCFFIPAYPAHPAPYSTFPQNPGKYSPQGRFHHTGQGIHHMIMGQFRDCNILAP